MKGINAQGQAVYYNVVEKHGKIRYQIQAASGQTLQGRDRQKRKSRTFAQEHQAAAWLRRMKGQCKNYVGAACVDGTCPIARAEEYEEYCMPIQRSCNNCWYYEGCEDCALKDTEHCEPIFYRR